MTTSIVWDDDLLKLYRPEKLNRDGYINLSSPPKFRRGFAKEGKETGASIREEERIKLAKEARELEKGGREPLHPRVDADYWVKPGEACYIHPVLQQDQFKNLSSEDWELVLPSVELASRIIDEPALLPFFNGISANVGALNDPEFEKKHGQKLFRWDFEELKNFDEEVKRETQKAEDETGQRLNAEQLREVKEVVREKLDGAKLAAFRTLIQYRERIEWRFRVLPPRERVISGWTEWKQSRSVVTLNEDYLSLLRGEMIVDQFSQPWNPGPDHASAILRTQVSLAITLVHEFAHCIWMIRNKNFTPDPFLRDRPVNELGYELENVVFSGIVHPIGVPERPAVPYGFKIDRFPGIWDTWGEFSIFPRGTPHDWGVKWATAYPVSMKWVSELFTAECWDRVLRFGFKALEPERIKGVRIKYIPAPPTATRGHGRARSRSPTEGKVDYRDRSTSRVKVRVSPTRDGSEEGDQSDDGFVHHGKTERDRHLDDIEGDVMDTT